MWDTRYRPLRFADVLGQDGSVRLLKARLRNGSALDTSYIFSGGHGQGKTTLARVHARAMLCQQLDSNDPEPCNECDNCRAILDETSVAFVELDAASKGTIDHIRNIVDDLPFAVFGAAKRLYLFDEAHRMGIGAQDVLLKPLEEKRMVGLFCTTEPEKIRGPIRSRCEQYAIRRVTREEVLARMNKILDLEGVVHEDDAVLTVIDYSGGHVRDVLNRLEMVAQMGAVDLDSVREYLHLRVINLYYKLLLALDNPKAAVELAEQICEQVTPEEAIAGVSEAAMNSYRLANGMFPDFSTADRALGQQVYERYGARTVKLAEFFLRNRYITQVGFLCDVLTMTQGIPEAPAQVTLVLPPRPAAPPASVPVVSVPAVSAPPVQSGPPEKRQPYVVDSDFSPKAQLVRAEAGPRSRKQENHEHLRLTEAEEDVETRPIHHAEWQKMFEANWRGNSK